MPAECSPPAMQFARLDGRAVVADFGGGAMTSDAGALLLGAADRAIGLVDRFAACFSDRTSAHTMRANQLRLWFAAMAHVLLAALRRIALPRTRLAKATCGSIRLKLLKIGAQVRLSTRRIRIAMATGAPHAAEFARAHARLCA